MLREEQLQLQITMGGRSEGAADDRRPNVLHTVGLSSTIGSILKTIHLLRPVSPSVACSLELTAPLSGCEGL